MLRARGLAGLGAGEGAARERRGAPSAPAPCRSRAPHWLGPAAAAGPAARPSTGWRRRRPGGPGKQLAAAGPGRPVRGSGPGGWGGGWGSRWGRSRGGEGPSPTEGSGGGSPRTAPSRGKTGTWAPPLHDLCSALELGRLKCSGEVSCSDSSDLLPPPPKPSLKPRASLPNLACASRPRCL